MLSEDTTNGFLSLPDDKTEITLANPSSVLETGQTDYVRGNCLDRAMCVEQNDVT